MHICIAYATQLVCLLQYTHYHALQLNKLYTYFDSKRGLLDECWASVLSVSSIHFRKPHEVQRAGKIIITTYQDSYNYSNAAFPS